MGEIPSKEPNIPPLNEALGFSECPSETSDIIEEAYEAVRDDRTDDASELPCVSESTEQISKQKVNKTIAAKYEEHAKHPPFFNILRRRWQAHKRYAF